MATGSFGVFHSNDAGFRALAVSEGVRAVCVFEAERAKAIAEGFAQDFKITGEYADSFEVTSATVPVETAEGPHEAAAGILVNTSDHAAAVEWGNSHDHRPHRVLGRTLDGLGGT